MSILLKWQCYGDPYRSLRNEKLQTPPGPEGSNGSSGFVCRGVAGRGHLQFPSCISFLSCVKTIELFTLQSKSSVQLFLTLITFPVMITTMIKQFSDFS